MAKTATRTVYRSCTPVIDTWSETDQPITDTLITALAEAEGVTPTELPPLYDAIDPDVLTRMFDEHGSETEPKALLSFTYGMWNVFVRADGRIRICDGTQDTDPTPVFEGTPS